MKIKEKEIRGVFEIQLEPHEDNRGFFVRTYDDKIFKKYGIDRKWTQENHSLSKIKGTVRGIHFQYPPDCETKVLRVITGRIFFVVIDLRKNSETFSKWTSIILSAKKRICYMFPEVVLQGCVL